MTHHNIVLTYFKSWQQQDFQLMRSCLENDVRVTSAFGGFNSADAFTAFCRQGPRWPVVRLLSEVHSETASALLYDGDAEDGSKFRSAEFIELSERGKIRSITLHVSPRGTPQ